MSSIQEKSSSGKGLLAYTGLKHGLLATVSTLQKTRRGQGVALPKDCGCSISALVTRAEREFVAVKP